MQKLNEAQFIIASRVILFSMSSGAAGEILQLSASSHTLLDLRLLSEVSVYTL